MEDLILPMVEQVIETDRATWFESRLHHKGNRGGVEQQTGRAVTQGYTLSISLMVCEAGFVMVQAGFLIKLFLFLTMEGGRVVKGGGL